MKVLTVCHGGNVRSVALAYVLKTLAGADALAASVKHNSPQTLNMLCDWADRIIVVQAHYADKIPQSHRNKVRVYDVGRDRWFNSLHPQLLSMFQHHVRQDPDWQLED
jgi:galactitol-specific phosphotransferase system IIB component